MISSRCPPFFLWQSKVESFPLLLLFFYVFASSSSSPVIRYPLQSTPSCLSTFSIIIFSRGPQFFLWQSKLVSPFTWFLFDMFAPSSSSPFTRLFNLLSVHLFLYNFLSATSILPATTQARFVSVPWFPSAVYLSSSSSSCTRPYIIFSSRLITLSVRVNCRCHLEWSCLSMRGGEWMALSASSSPSLSVAPIVPFFVLFSQLSFGRRKKVRKLKVTLLANPCRQNTAETNDYMKMHFQGTKLYHYCFFFYYDAII